MTRNESTTTKRPNKKLLTVILGGIAAIVALAVIVSLVFIKDEPDFIVYTNNEGLMYYDMLGKPRLIDADFDADDHAYAATSRDGKQIFFKYDEKLYRIGKNETEKELIAEDVISFYLHESGKKGLVQTYDDHSRLMYWDIKKGLTEIDTDILGVDFLGDFESIYYTKWHLKDEGKERDLYLFKDGESQLFEENVADTAFNESGSTVYFIREGLLYEKKNGKDAIRIGQSEDVYAIRKFHNNKLYYVLGEENQKPALYDGKKETVLEGCGDDIGIIYFADKKDLICYTVENGEDKEFYLARGGKSEKLSVPENTDSVRMTKDGKTLYCLVSKGNNEHDIYKMKLNGLKAGKANLLYSTNTNPTINDDGNIYYIENSDDCIGDLNFNGKLIDHNVDFHSMHYCEKTRTLFYNTVEKDGGETKSTAKKTVNGKESKIICENGGVVRVTNSGDVFFLHGEDDRSNLYVNRKSRLVEENIEGVEYPQSWGDETYIRF